MFLLYCFAKIGYTETTNPQQTSREVHQKKKKKKKKKKAKGTYNPGSFCDTLLKGEGNLHCYSPGSFCDTLTIKTLVRYMEERKKGARGTYSPGSFCDTLTRKPLVRYIKKKKKKKAKGTYSPGSFCDTILYTQSTVHIIFVSCLCCCPHFPTQGSFCAAGSVIHKSVLQVAANCQALGSALCLVLCLSAGESTPQ